jgi:DNA polymerase III subunit epsilon
MPIDFIALDFETANERLDSVCSLGIVRVENSVITDRKYRLIKPPEFRFNVHNIRIHGITPEQVENQKEFYVYWNALKVLLESRILVAHNADFDIGVLKAVLNTYQLDFPDLKYTCSLRISKRTWNDMPSYSLGNLGRYFGYEFVHHHALEDAEMSANLIIKACKTTGSESLSELHEKLQIIPGELYWNKQHIKAKSLKIPRNKK